MAALIAIAPLLAPQDPTDLGRLDLMNALLPPWWLDGASQHFPLGTDAQGRCLLSSLLYGLRLSTLLAATVVALSLTAGSITGLWAGHAGGWFDRLVMRAADAALSVHPVLVALVLTALLRHAIPLEWSERAGTLVVVAALGSVGWAPYARTARALSRAESRLPYVQAARLMRRPARQILAGHVLPNIAPALGALAVVQLGQAVFAESTLSFLGAGLPPTQPSLGGMVRAGSDFLLSGDWWLAVLPAAALALSIGTIGWLADTLARPGA